MSEKKRISKVTTKAGDRGTTKLATGRSLKKSSVMVRAIGSVDELNAHVGMLVSQLQSEQPDPAQTGFKEDLGIIQQALFDIGAVFAMEGAYTPPDTEGIEQLTTDLNSKLPPLTEFVLPGGGRAASQSHICRTVCRRAETDVWQLIETYNGAPDGLMGAAQYLNRLSDYFFVLARSLTATGETQWQGPKKS